MKKKLFLILNIIIAAMCYAGNYFYLSDPGIELKSTASLCFALLGAVNLVYAIVCKLRGDSLRFPLTMAIGLVMGMLGDIFIYYNFVAGAAFFAVAHISFLCSYFFICSFSRRDLIIIAIIFVPSAIFLLFSPALTFKVPAFKWVCLVYGFILCCMAGKAVSVFTIKRTTVTTILLIGSVLFFFSDFMLLLDWFMDAGRTISLLCMVAYYPAECTLAHSVFAYSHKVKISS